MPASRLLSPPRRPHPFCYSPHLISPAPCRRVMRAREIRCIASSASSAVSLGCPCAQPAPCARMPRPSNPSQSTIFAGRQRLCVRFLLARSNGPATCKTREFIDAQACLAKHRSQPTTLKNLPRSRARRPAQGRLITDTSTACWPSWPSSAASPSVPCHLPIESI